MQFARFALVGVVGFVVDAIVFFLLMRLLEPVMLCRLWAFWSAAGVTWMGNRYLTFRHGRSQKALTQWLTHMVCVHVAGAFNMLIFFGAMQVLPLALSFVMGIGAGMFANYLLASRVVFSKLPNP